MFFLLLLSFSLLQSAFLLLMQVFLLLMRSAFLLLMRSVFLLLLQSAFLLLLQSAFSLLLSVAVFSQQLSEFSEQPVYPLVFFVAVSCYFFLMINILCVLLNFKFCL